MSDQAPVSSPAPVADVAVDANAPTEAKPVTPPKKKAPAYRSIKVGDETVSLSDEDIARDYGKWKGADQKFREASEKSKALETFMEALEKDPDKILSDKRLPIDKKKLAEKWLVEQIEAELNPVDPRETALQERERKLKEWEDARALEKKTADDAEEQDTRTKALESRKVEISKTLAAAMASTQLSKHPESAAAVLREMALYMRAAKERGEDVSPDELVDHVHNNRFHQMYTLASSMEGEELIEFLSEDVVNRIRKADLARLKAGREQPQQHRNVDWGSGSKSDSKAEPRMDGHAARERARKMFGA